MPMILIPGDPMHNEPLPVEKDPVPSMPTVRIPVMIRRHRERASPSGCPHEQARTRKDRRLRGPHLRVCTTMSACASSTDCPRRAAQRRSSNDGTRDSYRQARSSVRCRGFPATPAGHSIASLDRCPDDDTRALPVLREFGVDDCICNKQPGSAKQVHIAEYAAIVLIPRPGAEGSVDFASRILLTASRSVFSPPC